jgi:hypothetical protein
MVANDNTPTMMACANELMMKNIAHSSIIY